MINQPSASIGGKSILTGLFALACTSPTLAAHRVDSIDETLRVRPAGNTHPQARAEFDRGRLADEFALDHMLLQLKRSPEQEQVLTAYLEEIHDPESENFQHWLSPTEFGELFGADPHDIALVTGWLRTHGFIVNAVYTNRMLIDFSGSAGQLRAAFGTDMHSFQVRGVQHIANANDPEIPVALAPFIDGIVSLHDFFPHRHLHDAHHVKHDTATGRWTRVEPAADFTFSYNGETEYDVTPQDFAKIYNVAPLWSAGITGKGQTIAVIEDTDIKNTSDVGKFRSAFGLSGYAGTFKQVHPSGCATPGVNAAEGEAALDAEWAAAVAPDAAIELASCKDSTTTFGGLIAAQNLLNASNPPAILSVSYGECEAENGATQNAAYNAAWQQAAAEGVSVYVSAGDEGAASCDADQAYAQNGIAISGFASTPYNVAVGGTDFSDALDGTTATYWSASNTSSDASAKSYIPEIPWNNSCASRLLFAYEAASSGVTFCNSATGTADFLSTASGSGGPSKVYAKPSWQSAMPGIVADGKRDIPDVSLFSASGVYGHSLVFCMSDSAQGGKPCTYSNATDAIYNSAGGTSFAAPAFAGIQALINQKKGAKQGNPNPRLYALAAVEYGSSSKLTSCNSGKGNASGSTCVFHDVTTGDIDVPCKRGTPNCYAGSSSKTYGVLSTSASTLKPAYTATSGWDFATGLGTVNVANLVNAW